jgi:hypothetical protein
MVYFRDAWLNAARAWFEAARQTLAPTPKMQRRALRRAWIDRHRPDERDSRPPGLLRMIILALFASLALAYQLVFLSDKIR